MFAFSSTYECAVHQFCIPCFYKLFPTGKTRSDVKLPPNVRPELCPRSSGGDQRAVPLYSSKARILTVGDGDLSFSRSLAQLGYAEKLTATTHESLQSIRSTYPNADEILDRLRDCGVTLFHEVDATNFEGHSTLRERSFDIVIWNFPCIRVERGADGQVSELEMNKQLLRTFFQSVKGILAVGGEVHIAHKTIEPFSWWGLCDIAHEESFQLFREIAFDRCNFPGYTNRKVLDRKSFPCHDARLYIFTRDPPGKHKSRLSKKIRLVDMSDTETVAQIDGAVPHLGNPRTHPVGALPASRKRESDATSQTVPVHDKKIRFDA